MTELFNLAAQVKLSQRLNNLLRIDENIEIDTSYITCAEYQLFIDQKRVSGENVQPDHWTTEHFLPGTAKTPIAGVRADDAEAFCQWLTQQQFTPGFQYRLPTSVEVQEHPILEKQVGCWCKDRERRVVVDIESEQWQIWQKKLVELLARDPARDLARNFARDFARDRARDLVLDRDLALARDLALDRDLARSITLDLNLARDLARDITLDRRLALDLACDIARDIGIALGIIFSPCIVLGIILVLVLVSGILVLGVLSIYRVLVLVLGVLVLVLGILVLARALGHSRTLELLLSRARRLTRAFAHARNHALAHARDLALALTRDRALALTHDLGLARDLARGLDLDLALDLDFDRSRIISEQDYNMIRCYLLLAFLLWDLLVDIYDRAAKNRKVLQARKLTRERCDELIRDCATKRDECFDLYTFFVLIDLRREGKMPAWEGIRIVRERVE